MGMFFRLFDADLGLQIRFTTRSGKRAVSETRRHRLVSVFGLGTETAPYQMR